MKSRPLIATRLLILATLLACNLLDRLHAQAAVNTAEQAVVAAMDGEKNSPPHW